MGCGWLGLPLAKSLIEDGNHVHGSTTSKNKLTELQNEGVAPFTISLSECKIHGPIADFLTDVEVLVINVPPKLGKANSQDYFSKMQLVHKAVLQSKIRKILFVSSTSVYGDISGTITENTKAQPISESGRQLLASENLFHNTSKLRTSIIRFGGLIGDDRHPIYRLSGKKDLADGNHLINLIHLKDCIGIIKAVINNDWWNEIFNGVYPYHPSKKDYYAIEAQKRKLPPPEYIQSTPLFGKKIDSSKLIRVKLYDFNASIQS